MKGDPGYFGPNSMMWKVMIECKKRAIEFLEIGETNFRETMHCLLYTSDAADE